MMQQPRHISAQLLQATEVNSTFANYVAWRSAGRFARIFDNID
jgi:hypothetical protein